jgi:hypothetical protein
MATVIERRGKPKIRDREERAAAYLGVRRALDVTLDGRPVMERWRFSVSQPDAQGYVFEFRRNGEPLGEGLRLSIATLHSGRETLPGGRMLPRVCARPSSATSVTTSQALR